MAEHAAAEAGITGVEFSSAGTISEEYDDPMDRRAAAVLKERGYRHDDHRARRITEVRIESADLVVAMEDVHLRRVLELAPDPSKVSPAHRIRPDGCTRVRCARSLVSGLTQASTTHSPRSKQPCPVCSTASVSSKTPTLRLTNRHIRHLSPVFHCPAVMLAARDNLGEELQ